MSGVSRGAIVLSLFFTSSAGGAGRDDRSATAAIVTDTLPLSCTPSLNVHDESTACVAHFQALLDSSTRFLSNCKLSNLGLTGADSHSAQIADVREC